MPRSRILTKASWTAFAAFAFALLATAPAAARTATFYSSTPYDGSALTSLSSASDRAGPTVALNNWIALLFETPFGTSKSDNVSIFTLPPRVGDARITVSFGRLVAGLPVFVETKSFNAGNTFSIGNLFQQGCFALGGCNYIFIQTTRQRGGAPGATIDYVSVNGEPTEIVEPTPEPAAWAMMMLGFAAVAWRLKATRRRRRAAPA